MKRLLFAIFWVVLAIIPLTNVARAEQEFQSEYIVTYNVDKNGETSVVYDINIINKRADVVATKYTLSLKQVNLYSVLGVDNKGEMEVEVSSQDDVISINVTLNDPAIGENKKNNFKINFKTKGIATKTGDVWNINIPPIQNLELTNKYDVILRVPQEFGPKIFVSPTTNKDSIENNFYLFEFDKNKLLDKGITASFGEYQTMNFILKYQLKNDSLLSNIQEIALPPEISNRQLVLYQDINPKPVKVRQDEDGNILASYKIQAKNALEVTLKGSARLIGEQIRPEMGSKKDNIENGLIKRYTGPSKYWETNAPEIRQIAEDLYDENKTISQNAQTAYEFVVKNLYYDLNAPAQEYIERKGALNTLKNPDKSACMGYTDLFVSIVRAMGIPARELNGYAFNNTEANRPLTINLKGGDLLHAWPEYYDPAYGWIAVDPTWGSTSGIDYFTKLDTNHFAFVVKGLSSEYPLPAGTYRIDDHAKLVEIEFSQDKKNGFSDKSALKQARSFVTRQAPSITEIAAIVISAAVILALLYSIIFKPNFYKTIFRK